MQNPGKCSEFLVQLSSPHGAVQTAFSRVATEQLTEQLGHINESEAVTEWSQSEMKPLTIGLSQTLLMYNKLDLQLTSVIFGSPHKESAVR